MYLVCEFFPLGALDVQLEIWEDRLSIPVRICLAQQICEVYIYYILYIIYIIYIYIYIYIYYIYTHTDKPLQMN
jgi:hypothetical protein